MREADPAMEARIRAAAYELVAMIEEYDEKIQYPYMRHRLEMEVLHIVATEGHRDPSIQVSVNRRGVDG